MPCEFINPTLEPQWNRRIGDFSRATFFHTSEWAEVLSKAYGYHPLYAALRERERILAVLPLMEVRSIWTGNRAVSLPFTDACPALSNDRSSLPPLLECARDEGRRRNWRYVELREDDAALAAASESEEFVVHDLALDSTEESQFNRLRDSNRRNIQKSEREGVIVEHRQGSDAMESFYRLHCQTRRRHGLPPQPTRFFRLIQQIVIEPGHGFVSLARFQNRCVAAAVYFQFRQHAIYKFGASDLEFQHLRANNFLMWSAISRLRREGMKVLSFGRTDLDDSGLLQFKRGWGAQETHLRYYRIGMAKTVTSKKPIAKDAGVSLSRRIMRRLPIPVLRLMGAVAYRHIA